MAWLADKVFLSMTISNEASSRGVAQAPEAATGKVTLRATWVRRRAPLLLGGALVALIFGLVRLHDRGVTDQADNHFVLSRAVGGYVRENLPRSVVVRIDQWISPQPNVNRVFVPDPVTPGERPSRAVGEP